MTNSTKPYTIAVVGPESTGKTVLCQSIAKRLECTWIPEYARTYVERLGRPYTYADVEHIAQTQAAELHDRQQRLTDHELLIADTDLIITKVWFAHVYKQMPTWIDQAIGNEQIDLYLLCQPDIPWQYDPVRENGTMREFFYNWYKREIERTKTPYAEIGGIGDTRAENAINAIKQHIDKQHK